ncbi:hypothetical protein [Frondihabitans sp. PAMC 28766]|uniref:hypothetical protein n=1 Tax=Frondihabitans sp. PAMC 28766 TaxID=1795630 RepID=UPI0012FF5CDB|nr:hypothetical protein [Frondihabitans sp. PAMC 28766]
MPLLVVCVALVLSTVASFIGVTRGIRRGHIRRAPKIEVMRACSLVMAREQQDPK